MNGLRLKVFRESLKMSQRDIAKLMNTTQANYWKLETGKSVPNAKQILQLCKIFKCTPNDLYGIRGVYEVVTMTWDD
ncbi:transcriptional repressor DicA [Acholeplasma oculi]|uniref:Cro/Cl family transcriptional regulator n=1 Tax=Acholeplasma oculi TaxID=35623 RepID=A0A061AFD1_9MOLU|nr:helix-turn-helix transcriptional regulator [Acholeplasma oculi]CDR30206.1 Cro/Cl family transcriptional regulator [Acholeplasma oculi]SKC43978.1 DNA-binding transcriptional regulator, XRE-family HTH domain [Acholeplasma oculi]SUT88578.1 transcriptional repressor DicA [Acholeplasma oculi]